MNASFKVYGMMCAACAAHVENAARHVEGVKNASVSLLTGGMQVEYEGERQAISTAIETAVAHAGYRAQLLPQGEIVPLAEERLPSRGPLILSLLLSALLMYAEMAYMMPAYPPFLDIMRYPQQVLTLQILLLIPILILNRHYFTGGLRSLFVGAPNMDSLIALGSGAAVLQGLVLYVLCFFRPDAAQLAMKASFASGGMIVTLVTLGKTLEGRAKDKTSGAIRALSALTPDTVRVERAQQECEIRTAQITLQDVLILRDGERIPCDGVLLSGNLSVDESALSGESLPVQKNAGDEVLAGCMVQSGAARVRPTKLGEQTSLSHTIRMVSEAAASKAPIAKTADRVSRWFVPTVLILSVATLAGWCISGAPFTLAVNHAISVLVISCPCALGLATPTAIMCAMGRGAEMGILIKSAEALEEIGRIRQIAFDKTGTLTTGQMCVQTHQCAAGVTEDELFAIANAVERESNHPIAAAIVRYTDGAGGIRRNFSHHSLSAGMGVFAKDEQKTYAAGNAALMEECEADITNFSEFAAEAAACGASVIYIADPSGVLGAFRVSDTPREDSADAIRALTHLGIRSVMLTGDAKAPAEAIGKAVGICEIYAGLTPQGKADKIREFAAKGKVAMVGDGINDALPLINADVGIAMGCASDVAIESCDAVLRKSGVRDVVRLVRLGRHTLRKIRENLFWAFIYNCVCIPIAAGALTGIGVNLSPMMASAAMALSSLTVVINALSIRLFMRKAK